MKKNIIIGITLLLLAVIGSATYWFLGRDVKKPTRYTRDPNAWIVPPVAYPMKGREFVVPESDNTKVVLDMIAPSAKHDYPMGKFSLATGTGEGQLYAMDDFATEIQNGSRVVPIVITNAGTGQMYYLAVIEESENSFKHVRSIYLGDRIRITSVTRTGDEVTVVYLVHDRHQAMTEVPSVSTTAIISIKDGVFVQEGKKPWLDAMYDAKEFTGKYLWEKTVDEAGVSVVPSKPDLFTLIFDGRRVSLGTDCNTGSAEMVPPTGTSTTLSFGDIATTRMFCQSSEEAPYFDMIKNVSNYSEPDTNTLIFTLKDGRVMTFVREEQKLEFESES